jgi:uncharacterized delta-60 repeat protein
LPDLSRLEDRLLLSSDLALDPTFGTGGRVDVHYPGAYAGGISQTFVQTDGKVVVVGDTYTVGDFDTDVTAETGPRISVTRFNPDGTLDSGFGNAGWAFPFKLGVMPPYDADQFNPWDQVSSAALQPDGKILVAGFQQYAASNGYFVARLNADGSPDTTFGAEGVAFFSVLWAGLVGPQIAIQPDGRILVSNIGRISADGSLALGLTRLNADGSTDNGFGTDGIADLGSFPVPSGLAVESNGTILVIGSGGSIFAPSSAFELAALRPDGTLDTGFGTGGQVSLNFGPASYDIATGLAVQSDGKILVAGTTADADPNIDATYQNYALARFNPDGSLDTTFNGTGMATTDFASVVPDPTANAYDYCLSMALQSDGRIVLSGGLTNWAGDYAILGLARLNANGTLDSSFGSGGKVLTSFPLGLDYSAGESLAVKSDGNIVLASSTPNGSYADDATFDGSPTTWDVILARYLGGPLGIISQSQVSSQLQALEQTVSQPGQSATVAFDAAGNTQLTELINAANRYDAASNTAGLAAAPVGTMTITVDMASGTYGGQTVNLWPGETLVINGASGGTTTFVGHSPALSVSSGKVVANGVTFTNATNAPVIVVSGGSLTVTQCTISSTGGYGQPAIQVTAGSLNLGTANSPGGNTINVVGAGALVQAAPTATVTAGSDTFQVNGTPVAASSLSFTTLTSSVSPSILNQGVTFTATVRGAAGSTTTPTGSVDFFDTTTGIDLGTISLVNGTATLTTSAVAAGSHTIRARYAGDTNFTFSLDTFTQAVDYKFGGFLAPLSTGVSYVLGRTIPVKFTLANYAGGAITSLTAVTSLKIVPLNPTGAAFNPVSTDGKGLTVSGGQFLFNWQTKGLSAGTYAVTLSLADGTTQTKTVTLSANGGSAGLVADGTTTAGQATAGALLGGDVAVYVDNSSGLFTADELSRINDAVAAVDSVVEPFGVTVSVTSDNTSADVVLDTGSTSAVGGLADGVLGCEATGATSTEITLIQGWNWYAGSDPTAVAAGQFDFQTVVMHELGHALGLGHSADPTSVMYATLAAGTANRNLNVADLNVPDADGGGSSGLHARQIRSAPTTLATLPSPALNQNVAIMAWDAAITELFSTGFNRSQRKRT